jgi:hypothetical protein
VSLTRGSHLSGLSSTLSSIRPVLAGSHRCSLPVVVAQGWRVVTAPAVGARDGRPGAQPLMATAVLSWSPSYISVCRPTVTTVIASCGRRTLPDVVALPWPPPPPHVGAHSPSQWPPLSPPPMTGTRLPLSSPTPPSRGRRPLRTGAPWRPHVAAPAARTSWHRQRWPEQS